MNRWLRSFETYSGFAHNFGNIHQCFDGYKKNARSKWPIPFFIHAGIWTTKFLKTIDCLTHKSLGI